MNPTLKSLIKSGIPVSEAHFHAAVQNANKTPETSFNMKSEKSSRKVQMWWTPHTLVCCQKSVTSGELEYWGVPISTVIFAHFLAEEEPKVG